MDPLIALLLCSSAFVEPAAGCENHRQTAIGQAVVIEAGAQRARSSHEILRVADAPDSASNIGQWQAFIAEAAQRFGIPEAWIRAVMRAESDGHATVGGRPIRSPAGAIGLMQVLPQTYAEMQRRHGLGPDPADPHNNILAGAAYLREMLDRFGYPHLFAAYNAGPERFEAYRRGEQPLPTETQAYLTQVGTELAIGSNDSLLTKQPSSAAAEPKRRRSLNPLLFFAPGRPSTLFVNHDESAPRAGPSESHLRLDSGESRGPDAPSDGGKSATAADDQGPP